MKSKANITGLINGIFGIAILLFCLDVLPFIDIKSQPIKSFAYIGMLILSPLALVWNLWVFKTKLKKCLGALIPLLSIVSIIFIQPLKIILWSSVWNTQTIIYQNKQTTKNTVEFQMQDLGAIGYQKRVVEVHYVKPWFITVNPVKPDIVNNTKWEKMDKEVNELNLKFP